MPGADSSLDGSGAVQPDERLEEGNENDDENRRPDSTSPAQIEAGGDDGQIVEVEKRDLLVDEPVNGEHRPDEQQHEDELEVLEDEPPSTIEPRLTDHRALMRDTHHMRDAQERGIATCGRGGAGRGMRDAGCGMRGAGRGARDAGRGTRDAGRGPGEAGRGTGDAGRGTRDACDALATAHF